MSGHPSRIALALFDRFGSGNDALRGDLVEEFHVGKSQWWLWRQVLGAITGQMSATLGQRPDMGMLTLGAAVLVLLSFEAVFVTNLMRRLVLGPPLANISGYLFLVRTSAPGLESPASNVSAWNLLLTSVAVCASVPAGWLIARIHRLHRALSLAAFSLSVIAFVIVTLEAGFAVQFVATLVFIVGLILSASVESARQEARIP